MSEATAPRQQAPELAVLLQCAEVLSNLIVTCLAPMFLFAAGGDINFARAAAAGTLAAYRAQTEADLIAIAQIVAFGLAALGSLSLAMEDDLSVSEILRLRGNANACNRSAQQNRRAWHDNHLIQASAAPPPPHPPTEPEPEPEPAEPIAGITKTPECAEETGVQTQVPVPDPVPPAAAAVQTDEEKYQAQWAASAAKVAAEILADIPNLPPEERQGAILRAAALKDCAKDLLSSPLPARLRPGDLAGFMGSPDI